MSTPTTSSRWSDFICPTCSGRLLQTAADPERFMCMRPEDKGGCIGWYTWDLQQGAWRKKPTPST